MSVKLADTLAPLGSFEVAKAEDISVEIDGTTKMLQTAIDNGEIGSGDSSFTGTHDEWEALASEEKAKYSTVYFTDDTDSALIDDTTSATDKVYSSSKVESLVNDWKDISSQCTVPSGIEYTELPRVHKNGKMIHIRFSPSVLWDGASEYVDVIDLGSVTFPFEQRFEAIISGMYGDIYCKAYNSKIAIYKSNPCNVEYITGARYMFNIDVFLLTN